MQRSLDSLAKKQGKTRSDIIKDSLNEYIERHGHSTPFELGKDLFGLAAGPDLLSQDRKVILTQQLQKKHEKRSNH